MLLTRQEIIEYASRYVTPEETTDFPIEGDLFCLLGRDLPEGKVLAEEEGWQFQGYGICLGYTLDQDCKPEGKWLWMHFASLATFPPGAQVFKLQPPHVIRGRFQNPTRKSEFRIIKVNLKKSLHQAVTEAGGKREEASLPEDGRPGITGPESSGKSKIVQFRKKKN